MPIEPMEQPGSGKATLAKTVGGAGIAAALIATVAHFEGKSNDPYQDVIGVWTVCYGDTNVAMRHYTDAQCQDMLAGSLNKYAAPVLAINPELRGHPNQIVAAVSLSYNIGVANYRRSAVAKDFRAGRWLAACNDFLAWDRAGGREVAGLKRRREQERAICLRNVP